MVNKSGKTGHPYVLDLRGNAFSFSPRSMILAVDLLIWSLLCSFHTHFDEFFIINGC